MRSRTLGRGANAASAHFAACSALLGLGACSALFGACGPASPATAPARGGAVGGGTELERARGYSVHEWGLVRGGAGDTLEAHTIGPGRSTSPMVVLKPVLYFHLAEPSAGVHLARSRVAAVEGEIREHWPFTSPSTAFPPAIDWGALDVEPGACATSFALPGLADLPCASVPAGEPCEAASLATVVADDADCVIRGGTSVPFLFYRSSTRGLTVPLRASRTGTGDLELVNDGELPIPGRVVRVRFSAGELGVAVFPPPPPHGSVTIAAGASSARDEAASAITSTLVELGLTDAEAAAFHRAWDRTLFGEPGAALDLSLSMETIPTLEESIVYFLPPELVERIATIDLDPPPTEIRRAMAVWTSF